MTSPRTTANPTPADGFVVAVTENHYRFELAEVAATTVMELTDGTTCEVTVVGGGGSGLAAAKGGRESEEARKIRRRIETFCDERGLAVERS